MPSPTSLALVAVPLVAFGYLLTSFAYCELERRQRDHRSRRLPTATVVALAALITTTISYYGTDLAISRDLVYVLAPVPLLLAPWDQVALWTGVAAVYGHSWPVWNGFRGGSGLPAALIVAFVYLPILLIAACGAWFAGMLVSKRKDVPTRAALVAAPVAAWIGWAFEVDDLWGLTFGAETTLATVVAVGLILARMRADARQAGAQ
jgi:glycerol-3-phosphate acyltransferase PlsY